MTEIPNWWGFLLLAGASFRIWRLLAEDTILDPVRERLVRLVGWEEGVPVPPGYRRRTAEFLTCPWCLGFWIGLAWWVSWLIWPEPTLYVAVPFTISAAVGLIAKLDP